MMPLDFRLSCHAWFRALIGDCTMVLNSRPVWPAACKSCADECEKHAAMKHCQVCAEACRGCEQACRQTLAGMAT